MQEDKVNFESLNDLPPPVQKSETLSGVEKQEESNSSASEKAYALALEGGVSVSQPDPQSTTTNSKNNTSDQSSLAHLGQQSVSSQSAGNTGSYPAIADDIDLIEKEWVEKAKEIVEQTKGNPYLQNTEISRTKADYLKKRYNKDLKISDT
jgi:hypothetical protein